MINKINSDEDHVVEYVVCVKEESSHLEESVPRQCSKCFCNVWCCPWNLLRIPICGECARTLDNSSFAITLQDLLRAMKEIGKKRR